MKLEHTDDRHSVDSEELLLRTSILKLRLLRLRPEGFVPFRRAVADGFWHTDDRHSADSEELLLRTSVLKRRLLRLRLLGFVPFIFFCS